MFLASTHWVPPPPPCDNQGCFQVWAHVPRGKITPSEKHCSAGFVAPQPPGVGLACPGGPSGGSLSSHTHSRGPRGSVLVGTSRGWFSGLGAMTLLFP